MDGFRPHESAVSAPSAEPSGAPKEMTKEYPSDDAMLNPSRTKKVGNQVTNPKTNVLTTMSVIAPTIIRGNSTGPSSEPRPRVWTNGGEGAGGGSRV